MFRRRKFDGYLSRKQVEFVEKFLEATGITGLSCVEAPDALEKGKEQGVTETEIAHRIIQAISVGAYNAQFLLHE